MNAYIDSTRFQYDMILISLKAGHFNDNKVLRNSK